MHLPIVAQTSNDSFDNSLGLIGASYRNGNNTRLFSRIVVSSWKQSISDVNHLSHGNSENIAQFPDSVGFVDARLGDVDRCRTADSDREIGNQSIEDCFDLRSLGEVWIPLQFVFQRRQLAECGIRYLASPIFNCFTPGFWDIEAGGFDRLIQGTDDPRLFTRREIFRIEFLPLPSVLEKLRAARRKNG